MLTNAINNIIQIHYDVLKPIRRLKILQLNIEILTSEYIQRSEMNYAFKLKWY